MTHPPSMRLTIIKLGAYILIVKVTDCFGMHLKNQSALQ